MDGGGSGAAVWTGSYGFHGTRVSYISGTANLLRQVEQLMSTAKEKKKSIRKNVRIPADCFIWDR